MKSRVLFPILALAGFFFFSAAEDAKAFELLNRVLGIHHHGCCEPACCEPACCEPVCCEPACDSCCDPCCRPKPIRNFLRCVADRLHLHRHCCCETACCDAEPTCCGN